MKKSYLAIGALVVILLIILIITMKTKSPAEQAAIDACLKNGGIYEMSTSICKPKGTPSIGSNVPGLPPASPSAIPAQTASGMVYSPASSTKAIHVTAPVVNATLTANVPITVSGEALGSWFFEATFPLTLTDINGKVISTGRATAQGNWMTEKFVPFKGTISYSKQVKGSKGFVILERDNPSGLPENAGSVKIPVTFL